MTDIIKTLQKQGLRVEEVNHPTYGKYIAWDPNNIQSCTHPLRGDTLADLKPKQPKKEAHAQHRNRKTAVDTNPVSKGRGKGKQSKGVEVRVQRPVRTVSGQVDLKGVLKGNGRRGRKAALAS